MARIDDSTLELTIGVLAVGDAALDLLAPRTSKLGIDREALREAPVFRFGLRGTFRGRAVVVVMSALKLDLLFQAA